MTTTTNNRTYIVKDGVCIAIIDHTEAAIQTINLVDGAVAMKEKHFYADYPVAPENHIKAFRSWHIRSPREFSGDLDRLKPTRK